MTETVFEQKWIPIEWPIPPKLPRVEFRPKVWICPHVGLPLKDRTDPYDLKRIWFKHDVKSWHIDEFRRVSIYKQIKRHLDDWQEFLRFDSTPKFYKMISRLKKEKDGAVIGIAGPKRSGKSLFGQMVLMRCINTTPHVLFRYRDFSAHVSDISESIGFQIDEDLKATGENSKNLAIHVNNAFETSRKADLWTICTGVNLNFEGWGDTLDLRLIPWGFNTKFQATRAAIVDKNGDFLGLMVLQRKHRPEDIVIYADDFGTWGEYKPRAVAYSRSVIKEGGATGAVSDVEQDRHIETLKLYFKEHYIDKGEILPNDEMCKRLYRKAKLPAISTGYTKECIMWAKKEIDDEYIEKARKSPVQITGEGWDMVRSFYDQFHEPAYSLYRVPKRPKMTWEEIASDLQEKVDGESLRRRVSRRLSGRTGYPPTTKALGDLGEKFIASLLDDLGPVIGGGAGKPDIIGRFGDVDLAISVKFTEKEHYKETEQHPEFEYFPYAYCVCVVPRLLEIRAYKLEQATQTINSRSGRLATTDTLEDILKEWLTT